MSNNKIHHVRILPQYFEDILSGIKAFEIRYNDRGYKVGDRLCLKESINGNYTGRETVREICYMIDDPMFCKEGYVVLGLKQSEGEWKKRGNEKSCSLCNFKYYSNNDEWSFCPKCGAVMSPTTSVCVNCRGALEVSISINYISAIDGKDYPPYLDRPKKEGE